MEAGRERYGSRRRRRVHARMACVADQPHWSPRRSLPRRSRRLHQLLDHVPLHPLDAIWIIVRPVGIGRSIACWSQNKRASSNRLPAQVSGRACHRHLDNHGCLRGSGHQRSQGSRSAARLRPDAQRVGLHDCPATMLGNTVQDEPLVFRGLIVTADPQVDRRTHGIGCCHAGVSERRNDTMDRRFVLQFARNGLAYATASNWVRIRSTSGSSVFPDSPN